MRYIPMSITKVHNYKSFCKMSWCSLQNYIIRFDVHNFNNCDWFTHILHVWCWRGKRYNTKTKGHLNHGFVFCYLILINTKDFFCNYTKLYKIGPLGFIFISSQRVYCFIIKIVEIYNKRSLWYIEVHTGDWW